MARATRYTVDEATATVVFGATSSVHPIRTAGSASGWFTASIEGDSFAGATGVSGHLEVPLKGLSSGNPLIDREMRRRLESDAHPTIVACVASAEVSASGGMTGTGTIEFFGSEVLVEGELRVVEGPRLVGTGEFDVRWWGLEPPRLMMLRVDPIVTVGIDLPLVAGP